MMTDEFNSKLEAAIKSGHLDNVRCALDAGANADEKFENGMTPLQLAVVLGYSEIVELLLDKQIQIDTLNSENVSALHLAARTCNEKIVELLLEWGANVNPEPLENTLTPLGEACKSCDHRIVKLLLDKEADINARSNHEDTPLHIAISNEEDASGPYCSMMLLEHGANVNAYGNQWETPLSLAAKRGSVSLVKEILLRGPTIDSSSLCNAVCHGGDKYVDIVDCLIHYGFTFYRCIDGNVKYLEESIKNGHFSAVKSLIDLDKPRDVYWNFTREIIPKALETKDLKMLKLLLNCKFHRATGCNLFLVITMDWVEGCELLLKSGYYVTMSNDLGETALHRAKSGGMAKLLLDKGANLQVSTKQGLLPLQIAVKNNYKEVVSTIIEYNVSSSETDKKISVVNECDKLGRAPLHYAISKDVAQLLLDNGAQLDTGDHGYSPLHAAAQNGHEEVVSVLLQRGAKVNAKTKYGMTPLHYAARRGSMSIVNELIQYGAEIDPVREYGYTPLCDALQANKLDIAEVLLNSGANVGVRISNYRTPLNYAAKKGLTAMVECMLRHGVDIKIKDNLGKTALHIAAENGKYDVVLLLLEAGADVNKRCKQRKTPLDYAKNFIVSSSCGNITNQRLIEAIESKNKLKLLTS